VFNLNQLSSRSRSLPHHSSCSRWKQRRRAVAVVELAICLPVLALITMATVEACAMLHLQQNAAVTAYEGARVGILPGADQTLVMQQCEMLLEDRGISNYTVSLNPADPTTMVAGDEFAVNVTIDCNANAIFGGFLYEGRQLSEVVVMRAE